MKHQAVTAHPLVWPEEWKRTPAHVRKRGDQFVTRERVYGENNHSWLSSRPVTIDHARQLLMDELGRLKARAVVVSSNVPLRQDGQMRADRARVADPGIAVYFQYKGKPMVMAADAYDGIAANLRSLGLAIEALRQLERHGGGVMMERAFAGFTALPPPEGSKPKRPWWEVLRYSADPADREFLSSKEVEARWQTLAKRAHPDAGGSTDAMQELNAAKEDALAELSANNGGTS